ncbi:MAG: hypothetical protein B7C24_01645 [Bacteroidetes bacterium 4572_77]|nr:MAG: hypothetical protein B7C24_01645 [Bacteroidetes bacterium 4572_77]
MKNILLSLVFSFCTISMFAQNNGPQHVNYKTQQNTFTEKAGLGISEYDFDMMFEESNTSGGRFGWTVSSAGDFNGDGMDDVIVGADMYNNSTGYVGLFFGGDNIETNFIFTTGENAEDFFGGHITFVGDYNNDGFGDFLVNANGFNNATGRCYLFLGSATPDLEADLIFDGSFATEWFGYRHNGNGDLNNDGYSDIVISSENYSNDKGAVYVFFGGETPNNTVDFTYYGEYNSNSFGNTVSIDGDANNDGYDDVLITARGYNGNDGKAYLYLGGETLTDTPETTFERTYDTDYYAYTSSFAGDINNDGFDDFMIGAYGAYGAYGRAYLYLGSTSPDNTADLEFYKDTNGCTDFAKTLSNAGDFNNDGYDDFMIGDPMYNDYNGAAYIYYGAENPDNIEDLLIESDEEWEGLSISMNKAGDLNNDGISDIILGATGSRTAKIYYGSTTPDTQWDISLEGAGTDNWFGYSTSSAGDFNNDGFEDLIVGAYGYDHYRGRSYIYFGGDEADNEADITLVSEDIEDSNYGWSVAGIGDINNDGFDDVAVGAIFYGTGMPGKVYVYYGGATPDSIVDVVINQNTNNDWLGYFINTAGDVNNDGFDDFVVGAAGTQSTKGKAYLYLGSEDFSGEEALIYNDGTSGSWFGASVSSLDFNNDGFDDVIVGAPGHNNLTGKFDLYYGSATPDNISDYTVNGYQSESVFGHTVSGIEDFNGDGYDDIITGATDYNLGGMERAGQAYIYYGGEDPDQEADLIIDGEMEEGGFARFVNSLGDLNNDGYGDVGIGAYKANICYIYYGAQNPNNIADINLTENDGAYSWSFTTSDFNGSGNKDLFVSAYGEQPNGKTYMYQASTFVSIAEQPTNKPITIYPNPSNGSFTIENLANAESLTHIEILDISGKSILKRTYNAKDKTSQHIDLSDHSKGVYFLIAHTKHQIFTQKVIIQ